MEEEELLLAGPQLHMSIGIDRGMRPKED
ncbi:uncharacterized protein G2W53_018211 [Senna tora]|uniref:Uncharacterized protein n=1 Tax=Senna tora TaxID=362788 RepID=A0A834WL56_9FABA|nr:uncharacterized protein G2W53_018211 [Senna tora]